MDAVFQSTQFSSNRSLLLHLIFYRQCCSTIGREVRASRLWWSGSTRWCNGTPFGRIIWVNWDLIKIAANESLSNDTRFIRQWLTSLRWLFISSSQERLIHVSMMADKKNTNRAASQLFHVERLLITSVFVEFRENGAKTVTGRCDLSIMPPSSTFFELFKPGGEKVHPRALSVQWRCLTWTLSNSRGNKSSHRRVGSTRLKQ